MLSFYLELSMGPTSKKNMAHWLTVRENRFNAQLNDRGAASISRGCWKWIGIFRSIFSTPGPVLLNGSPLNFARKPFSFLS